MNKTLYDQDFYKWLEVTLKQLRERDTENLDWEHLIEEVESLGRSEKNAVDGYLYQLLFHLLMLQYWESEQDFSGNHWRSEVVGFRFRLNRLLQSGMLRNYFSEEIDSIYPKARKGVIAKSELPADTFPEKCPYTPQQLLDEEFYP
jgi:hypothetical protein